MNTVWQFYSFLYDKIIKIQQYFMWKKTWFLSFYVVITILKRITIILEVLWSWWEAEYKSCIPDALNAPHILSQHASHRYHHHHHQHQHQHQHHYHHDHCHHNHQKFSSCDHVGHSWYLWMFHGHDLTPNPIRSQISNCIWPQISNRIKFFAFLANVRWITSIFSSTSSSSTINMPCNA